MFNNSLISVWLGRLLESHRGQRQGRSHEDLQFVPEAKGGLRVVREGENGAQIVAQVVCNQHEVSNGAVMCLFGTAERG